MITKTLRRYAAFMLFLILSVSVFSFLFAAFLPPVYAAETKIGVTTAALNVRTGPGTDYSIDGTLAKGDYVLITGVTESWTAISYNGNIRYCSSDYITEVSFTIAYVNVEALNIRSGAGTDYSKSGILYSGDTVYILSTANGWHMIAFQSGAPGYVYATYISATAPEPEPPSEELSVYGDYPQINLDVVSYKQNDPEWKNVLLGSTYTIGQIGCTTSALAMSESLRLNTRIYPDEMSERLIYESNGSLYWPKGYTDYRGKTDYLSKAYLQLQKGIPVIIGSYRNPGSSSHYVIITGFSGGALLPENFMVNDPGSGYRSDLSQFLKDFPYFIKIEYYVS